MSAPLNHSHVYRSLLREFRLSSILPRAKRSPALLGHLRSLVYTLPSPSSEAWSVRSLEILEVGKFMRAQRIHKDLLERYNPTHGMTVQERTRATARRVGLDVPKEGRPMGVDEL